jgi:hypothetical protein
MKLLLNSNNEAGIAKALSLEKSFGNALAVVTGGSGFIGHHLGQLPNNRG